MRSKIKELLNRVGDYLLNEDAHNIQRAMQRRALEETSQFVEDHLYQTRVFRNKYDLLAASLAAVGTKDGLYCEFGVHTGATVNFIAAQLQNTVFGFDSFEGLPENWQAGIAKGHFAVAKLPDVRPNVRLIKGWFHETLPEFVREHTEYASFVHIDCDLYSSTRTIFDLLGDRFVPGTVLSFDEFFNYPGWRKGEYRAFQEFVTSRCLEIEYIGYVVNREQVAIRIMKA